MSENRIYTGAVCWFDNRAGYGFLLWEIDGVPQKDMFIHFSDVNCEGFKTLKKDQKVSFQLGTNNRGQPKAVNVQAINE